MCFGGGQTPVAPVNTPAVPPDQITAGQPTITAAPDGSATSKANPANNPAPAAPRTATSPPVLGEANVGLDNLGI